MFIITLPAAAKAYTYPIPHIQDLSALLVKKNPLFSKIDLVQGYHQIPVASEDMQKTAIATPLGLCDSKQMLHGLKNSTQDFHTLMDTVLPDL